MLHVIGRAVRLPYHAGYCKLIHSILQAGDAEKQVGEAVQVTDLPSLRDQYTGLEQAASASSFWDDQESAQATLQQMSELRGTIQEIEGFQGLLGDVQTAIELAEMEAWLVALPPPWLKFLGVPEWNVCLHGRRKIVRTFP